MVVGAFGFVGLVTLIDLDLVTLIDLDLGWCIFLKHSLFIMFSLSFFLHRQLHLITSSSSFLGAQRGFRKQPLLPVQRLRGGICGSGCGHGSLGTKSQLWS